MDAGWSGVAINGSSRVEVADDAPRMSSAGKLFLTVAFSLVSAGLVMVYSASVTSRPTDFEEVYLARQLTFLAVASGAALLAGLVPARQWQIAAPWLFAATVLLLALVLVPGIGTTVKGARRWLRIGGWSLQPSELAKLTLPLLMCATAADGRWRQGTRLQSLATPLLPIAAMLLLVASEPDLGTALFLGLTGALALYFSGWPLRRFLIGGAAVLPLLAGLLVVRPYQLARVEGYLASWRDFNAAPYQIRQSLIALGSGGATGVGLGLGQQKLGFLPESNTDFVLAVIGEELGLAGTVGVLLLWGGLYVAGLRLLSPLKPGGFRHALTATLLTSLVAQAAVNMAVVLALLPPKGISLPLISYGGSNLLASLLALGMIVSLSREAERETSHVESVEPAAKPSQRPVQFFAQ